MTIQPAGSIAPTRRLHLAERWFRSPPTSLRESRTTGAAFRTGALVLNLILLLALGGLAGCGEEQTQTRRKPERTHLVETALVSSDNLSVMRTRTGTLRARREVKIFTQEDGRITQLPFYEGDKVAAGDVVVRLDDTLIRVQLKRATATRRQAEQDVERLRKLRARKVASEDEYTRAVTQRDVARADEDLLSTRLGYTRIASPLTGVVEARLSEPGNIAERHQHLLTISDPSSLLTELPVSGLILPYLATGDIAKVRIDALGDRVFEGRIIRIHHSLDPLTRRGIIEVELQPVPKGAAPGQLCRVELITQRAERRVIPFAALRRDSASEYVFIVDGEGKAQRVAVVTGLRLAEKIEVTDGLKDGQRVVTKGFLGLVAEKAVAPVKD